jgi:hypothetical protein
MMNRNADHGTGYLGWAKTVHLVTTYPQSGQRWPVCMHRYATGVIRDYVPSADGREITCKRCLKWLTTRYPKRLNNGNG